jgi:hypothetical protein
MVRSTRGLSSVVLLCLLCLPSSVSSQRGSPRLSVAIGDTGARVGGEPVAEALEEALHAAIAARPDLREEESRRARYVVTGSVTELDAHPTADGHEVRITVSIVVADRGGSVRAMLSGRAAASGDLGPPRLTADALRAAVRSAMRPLGETLR